MALLASELTVKLKIEPEMTDTARALLREMIITEMRLVFSDTPMGELRGEMRVMVKEAVEQYIKDTYLKG